MKRIAFLIGAAFAVTPALADVAISDPCANSESVVFACRTAQKRWIGLCETPSKALQYRFGRERQVELRYPADPDGAADAFRFARYSRYRTERVEVTFANAAVDYAVFDYREGGTRRSGVRVTTNGKEREILCAGPVRSRLPELEKTLRCDSDNALNGGRC